MTASSVGARSGARGARGASRRGVRAVRLRRAPPRERLAERRGGTGARAVEMFDVAGEAGPRVRVNELAMRPHNSGHWTIDGAVTSQFEQHLRAVLDLPLGDTASTARWTVMANVLGSTLDELTDALPDVLAAFPDARVHLYG